LGCQPWVVDIASVEEAAERSFPQRCQHDLQLCLAVNFRCFGTCRTARRIWPPHRGLDLTLFTLNS